MSGDLKPCTEYKPSRLPWLGRVPAHWTEKRAKYLYREVDERSDAGTEELLSVSHITGVAPRRQKTVTMFMAESYVGHKLCRPGDLVINTMWAWMAALGIAKETGLVSPSYAVYRPLEREAFNADFVDHLLRTFPYQAEYLCRSTGIRSSRLRLYPERFLEIPILCPPREEQRKIVSFLKVKDQEIRRLIRVKRCIIELLNEQKQAIIHRAVTCGLDPTVPLKPSGIDWLGDIPAHWHEYRIASLASSLQTGPFGSQLHSHEYVEGGVPVINPSHMAEGRIVSDPLCSVSLGKARELERHICAEGDVLFARRGELGRCALVTAADVGCLCGTGSIRMQVLHEKMISAYLVQLLQLDGPREWLSLRSVGATMENLNPRILANLPLPIPPLQEQATILEYISKEVVSVEAVVAKTRSEIDLIREYRTRLVSDVVTGQLDVRHLDLPDVEDEPVDLAGESDDVDELAGDDGLAGEELAEAAL